jgi:hypothetical protein
MYYFAMTLLALAVAASICFEEPEDLGTRIIRIATQWDMFVKNFGLEVEHRRAPRVCASSAREAYILSFGECSNVWFEIEMENGERWVTIVDREVQDDCPHINLPAAAWR